MTRVLLCASVVVISLPPAAASTLTVKDEAGEAVAEFEAMIHTADHGYTNWTLGRDGRVPLRGVSNRASVIDVIVRAAGYAPAVVSFSGEERSRLVRGEATVVLERGRTVDVLFRLPTGMTLPDGFTPELYFTRFAHRVRIMRQPENSGRGGFDFDVVNAVPSGPNQFSIRLPKDPLPFYVAIHHPGFLQLFEAGPFTASDVKDGALEIHVPRPAAIDVTFDPGAEASDIPYESATLSILWRLPLAENGYCSVAYESSREEPYTLRLADLAPATYLVQVRTKPKPDVPRIAGLEINSGAFFASRRLTLQPGKSATVRFEHRPFDPDAWRGDRTAIVRILNPDGSPAAGEQVRIGWFDGHYGALPVFDGLVPDSGEVEVTGITGQRVASDFPYGSYWVAIDGRRIGDFDLSGTEKAERFSFRIPLRAGDAAPDIELVEIDSRKTVRLSALRGKIVLLEFWATWCGPCQPAMDKLNKLAAERRAQWGERVALVALSIDDSIELVDPHVSQRGWIDLQHFWSGGERTGTRSSAARSFVIDAIPVAFLIDPAGTIVWRGHPVSDDAEVESRIRELLSR